MKWRIIIGVITAFAPVHLASAQDFPRHDTICVNGIVSKPKLAIGFLNIDPRWKAIYGGSLHNDDADPSINPLHRPRWQGIFLERPEAFCKNNPACLGPDPDSNKPTNPNAKQPQNTKAAIATINQLRRAFENSLVDNTRPGKSYSIADSSIGVAYFANDNKVQINCLTNEPPAASKPPDIKLPFRLRANSDDLNIPGGDPKFQGVKPATVSFKRDGVDQKTNTAALQAAIGVPIALGSLAAPSVGPDGFSSFTGELVPYISANQTVSKVAGKAATLALTNNVAVGTLLNMDMTFNQMPGVDHYFVAKPQYLWNTKDRSEIASLTFIYQPWSDGTPPAINTPFPPTTVVDGTWMQLLFDLRNDVGDYTKKGIDPVAARSQTSFDRAGSKFGFAFWTDEKKGPHVVMNVTETMLYGFAGSVRQLSLFDSNISFYFDSTSNFAFTVAYTKGQDEYTAVSAQTVTAGFSAKF
jgi:hypothetical protein